MDQQIAVPSPLFDPQEIVKNLDYLFEKNQRVELRAFKKVGEKNHVRSGIFNDWHKLAACARDLERDEYNVCFGLSPRIGFPVTNDLDYGKSVVGDSGIEERRFILIDADPVREEGTCSTDEQGALADQKINEVVNWLTREGWPKPALAESGNGWHAIYRVDLKGNDGGITQDVLKALDARFSDKHVRIDEGVYNASQVCRLYGTLNRKSAIADAPQRRSKLYVGERLSPVVECLLKKVASQAPVEKSKGGGGSSRSSKKRDEVLDLVQLVADLEYWHDGDKGWVTLDDPVEDVPVDSIKFRQYLMRRNLTEGAPVSVFSVDDAVANLEAAAMAGDEFEVHKRVAEHDGAIIVDLHGGSYAKITKEGWKIIDKSPVKFRRGKLSKPFPLPVQGGNVADLRRFLNVRTDGEFLLLVAFVVMAFKPSARQFPHLVLTGEQGSSKSTICRILQALIDPNGGDLKSLPKTEDSFAVSASKRRLLIYDNVSRFPDWISDAACRYSDGLTYEKRKNYTDDEEAIIRGKGSIIFNSIADVVVEGDLLNRSIVLDVPPLKSREVPEDFEEDFQKAMPSILGGIFDAVSEALKNEERVRERDIRMATFAGWSVGAEPALIRQWNATAEGVAWTEGQFLQAYRKNIDEAVTRPLDGDSIVFEAIEGFIKKEGERLGKRMWEGSSTTFYSNMEKVHREIHEHKLNGWPGNAGTLTTRMKKLRSALRPLGIDFAADRTKNRGCTTITVTWGLNDESDPNRFADYVAPVPIVPDLSELPVDLEAEIARQYAEEAASGASETPPDSPPA